MPYEKDSEDLFQMLLKIQLDQLKEWQLKLNNECFIDLALYITECNMRIDYTLVPYTQVVRGVELTSFIENWEPKQ